MRELRFSLAVGGDELMLDAWLIEDGRSEVRALQQPVALHAQLGDPDLLPDRDLGRRWGMNFGDWLHPLLPDAGVDRISFRPLDPAAARLPFETLVSPDDEGRPIFQDGVSLIRLPQRLDVPVRPPGALSGSEPGRHVARALAAPARGLDLNAFVDAVASLEGRRGLRASVVAAADEDFAGEFGDAHVDLLLCCGHGTSAQGWQLGRSALTGEKLAQALGGRPAAVILAMCQSASSAAQLAASGIGLAVGFQGSDSPEIDVRNFVEELLKGLRASLLEGAQMFGVWERALLGGRNRLSHAEGVLPVVVAHPDLLAGITRARVTHKQKHKQSMPRHPPAIARPFYVPGQVCWWREDGQTLRLPLPVDAGALLRLQITTRGRAGSVLAAAWGLPEHWGLDIDVSTPPAVAGWATRSAELSASIRALSHLLDEPPPDAVLALLDDVVASDWGAHDAAPGAVAVGTGSRVLLLGEWPAIDVKAHSDVGLSDDELRNFAPPIAPASAEAHAATLGAPDQFLALVRRFRQSVSSALPVWLLSDVREHSVFVPSTAELFEAKRAPGLVRLSRVTQQRQVSALDTLRVR